MKYIKDLSRKTLWTTGGALVALCITASMAMLTYVHFRTHESFHQLFSDAGHTLVTWGAK